MKTKRAIISLAAVLAVLTLLAGAAGCASIGLAFDLRSEPDVMDASIHIDGDTITCKVILKDDAGAPAPGDGEKYAEMAMKAYPGKTVVVNVVLDGVTLESYRLE